MMTSSSKESSAARIDGSTRTIVRGSERVTPLLREPLRSASAPLREITRRAEEAQARTLPVLATAGDVRELVRLLKKRTAGITLVAAMNSEQKRIFDPRKIAAYEFWGIVAHDGERIRLTQLGLEIAHRLEPEARIYRTVLDNIVFYGSALEWIFRQSMDIVTHLEIAAYWQEHYPEAIDEHDEKMVEGSVVCFFHLCQAAELGTMTIGKRGQPSRLHIERKELSDYIQAARPSPPVERFNGNRSEEADPATQETKPQPVTQHEAARASSSQARERLLISHGKTSEIVAQIRVTLELAEIESEIVERTGEVAEPVAEHILQAMRRCDRAVIVVTASDCSTDSAGRASLKEDVLIEIGAAFIFYDRRVVLLWDEGVPVPSNLQNLSRCRFDGDKLTWEAGVSLMRAIKELKD